MLPAPSGATISKRPTICVPVFSTAVLFDSHQMGQVFLERIGETMN
jgi:hypothetical protein